MMNVEFVHILTRITHFTMNEYYLFDIFLKDQINLMKT